MDWGATLDSGVTAVVSVDSGSGRAREEVWMRGSWVLREILGWDVGRSLALALRMAIRRWGKARIKSKTRVGRREASVYVRAASIKADRQVSTWIYNQRKTLPPAPTGLLEPFHH